MSNIPKLEITEQGIVTPDFNEILDGTLEDFNEAFGGAMNKDITTPQGQIATSMAWSINQKDQQLTYLANQFNPDYAEGRFQDALASIYFIERIGARGTTVTARCTGLASTIIPKGSAATDDNGYIYYSSADGTINNDGYADIIFVNSTTGPIGCPIGSLNTIYKDVIGWDSINNLVSGALGRDMESRNDFEARRKESVAHNSNNQNSSILSDVLQVDGVVDAYVYSNDSGQSINYGATNYPISAHSLCISVYGGDSKDIAQAIWENKNPGCGMVGNTTRIIQDTENYAEPYPTYSITYLVPTATQVYFKITIQKDGNLPSTIIQDIQSVVKSIFSGETGSGRARIGGRLLAGRFYSAVSGVSDYVNIDTIFLSKDNSEFSSSIQFGIDEMPVVSSSTIEVILNEN